MMTNELIFRSKSKIQTSQLNSVTSQKQLHSNKLLQNMLSCFLKINSSSADYDKKIGSRKLKCVQ